MALRFKIIGISGDFPDQKRVQRFTADEELKLRELAHKRFPSYTTRNAENERVEVAYTQDEAFVLWLDKMIQQVSNQIDRYVSDEDAEIARSNSKKVTLDIKEDTE